MKPKSDHQLKGDATPLKLEEYNFADMGALRNTISKNYGSRPLLGKI